MKCFLLVFGFASLSITYIQAQSLMIGAGGSYGTSVEQFGLNSRLYYGLNEKLCFGPEFAYFPAIVKGDEKIQLNEYGFVVHYIIEVKEKIGFYPLTGINYSNEKRDHLGLTYEENAFGASFGAGMHFSINNFLPFVEYKYITGKLSQNTVSLGMIYNVNFSKE